MNNEPTKLFTIAEVAGTLGVSRAWVRVHIGRTDSPPPDFIAGSGRKQMKLWTLRSLDRWRAYHASDSSTPVLERFASFSDHNAVNYVGALTITWKLWWRNTHDGGAMWWFSTPRGWYVSDDDGRTWDFADVMVRPGGYRYHCVNGNASPSRAVAAILRSTEKLRQQLTDDKPIDISPVSELA